jgi:hypothetical protein
LKLASRPAHLLLPFRDACCGLRDDRGHRLRPGQVTEWLAATSDTAQKLQIAQLAAHGLSNREHDTLISIEKARRLLGYRPVYGWGNAGTS